MSARKRLAILGVGNIGGAIAEGLVAAERVAPSDLVLTRRRVELLDPFRSRGFGVASDNRRAVAEADAVLVAVEPQQIDSLLREISGDLDPGRHRLISVVSGVGLSEIRGIVGDRLPVARAMPNTAVSIGESMTCLAADPEGREALELARSLFDSLGRTLVLDEEQMIAATALAACGVAFFLRAVRAASQGGIEIGLHPGDALVMAAQTARGAASLVLRRGLHPEEEIDRVTTPRGCTIAGLNRMEHEGYSSALIRGIVASAEKAGRLYRHEETNR